jgi:hypothetical protein
MNHALIVYVLSAMLYFAPPKVHANLDASRIVTLERYDAIATSIVSTVEASDERFDGESPERNAVELASIAAMEDKFWAYVDEARCATPPPGYPTCDGGLAHSIWQIHAEGIVITTDGEWEHDVDESREWMGKHLDSLATPTRLDHDREFAAKVALHEVRKSMRRMHGLGGYTGEGANGPKARERLAQANAWLASHPFITER